MQIFSKFKVKSGLLIQLDDNKTYKVLSCIDNTFLFGDTSQGYTLILKEV